MYKHISIVLFLALIIFGCEKDNGTEPENLPTHDEAMLGKWALTTCRLNGVVVSYENFSDCPVEYQYNANGTGIVWKKDYGIATGTRSFRWSTSENQLTIHEEGEYPFVSTYVVSGETYTISFADEGNVEMVYTKQ